MGEYVNSRKAEIPIIGVDGCSKKRAEKVSTRDMANSQTTPDPQEHARLGDSPVKYECKQTPSYGLLLRRSHIFANYKNTSRPKRFKHFKGTIRVNYLKDLRYR